MLPFGAGEAGGVDFGELTGGSDLCVLAFVVLVFVGVVVFFGSRTTSTWSRGGSTTRGLT